MSESKTNMEIFDELYPTEEIESNPLTASNAMGYLKCLEQFCPYLESEIGKRYVACMLALLKSMKD